MKAYIYLVLLFCFVTSCYTYKPFAEEKDAKNKVSNTKTFDPTEEAKVREEEDRNASVRQDVRTRVATKKQKESSSTPRKAGIEGKLEPNKRYKIEVADKWYKIQVDNWEGDSLVVHSPSKPTKKFKFHKKQINESTILERRFSQPMSDIITVGVYAGIAAVIAFVIL